MGLDERIQDEMYVDTESLLEDEFDRAKELYDIYMKTIRLILTTELRKLKTKRKSSFT